MQKHTRRVRIYKMVLPIAAIIGIGFVFLINWQKNDEITNQFTTEDTNFSEPNFAATKPEVNVVTATGDQYFIQAQSVEGVPNAVDQFDGRIINSSIVIDGTTWEITADLGSANSSEQSMLFSSNVSALVDEEYKLQSQKVYADIEAKTIFSNQPILISHRLGEVEASGFTVSGEKGSRILILTGNVVGAIDSKGLQ